MLLDRWVPGAYKSNSIRFNLISLKGSVQLKALLEEEDTALPLQSEEKEGRKISSRIEAATNSEEEDRSVGFSL